MSRRKMKVPHVYTIIFWMLIAASVGAGPVGETKLPEEWQDLGEDAVLHAGGAFSYEDSSGEGILTFWRPVEPGDSKLVRRFRRETRQLHLARGIGSIEALEELAKVGWEQLWLLQISPWCHQDFSALSHFRTVEYVDLLTTLGEIEVRDLGEIDSLKLVTLEPLGVLDVSGAKSLERVELQAAGGNPREMRLHDGVTLLMLGGSGGLSSNYYHLYDLPDMAPFDLATLEGAGGLERLETGPALTASRPISFPSVRTLSDMHRPNYDTLAAAFPNLEIARIWRIEEKAGVLEFLKSRERLREVDLAVSDDTWTKADVEAVSKALPGVEFHAILGGGYSHWGFNGERWYERSWK